MGNIVAEIKSVNEILNIENLKIPEYQRPYRWNGKNVRLLLEDIFTNKNTGKQKYRIGSIILHKDNENNLMIVDGQQRITTLLILDLVCNRESKLNNKLTFSHHDSLNNIKLNYLTIDSWIKENCENQKKEYWNYVIENCEFVIITVEDLSEAFQMFDSQNGRGKELEAYNLLKAYHIRAMEQESFNIKIACDKQWEAATMYDATPNIEGDPNMDILKQLFNEQLYRGRLWSKNHSAKIFSKKDIDEFKGFTIDKNHSIDFPFQNPQLLHYLTAKFYKNILAGTVATQSRFNSGDNEHIDPFVNINQQIVNGKAFFDYVETYVEIYKCIFVKLHSYQLSKFKKFYYKYCLNYGIDLSQADRDYVFLPVGNARRLGDSYLREAYKTLIFILFDKFGENGLMHYYETLYKLIYSERLLKSQIKYNAVSELPKQYASIIAQARNLSDLSELDRAWNKKNRETQHNQDKFKNIHDNIKNFIYGNN